MKSIGEINRIAALADRSAALILARELQDFLAGMVETADRIGPVSRVAGLDVGFRNRGRLAVGAVAVYSWPELELIEEAVCSLATRFPYIPGYLSFREVPVLVEAFSKIVCRPDLLLCDGQGRAHPRGMGIACHLGLELDLPSIGVGKSRLVGEYLPPGSDKGASSDLVYGNEVVGSVVRSRARVKPVFVSSGHRVSLDTARQWVLRCCTRYRLPEPVRRADRLAGAFQPGRGSGPDSAS